MKQSIRDIDVRDKRVLMRVDFNVPFDANGEVADDSRISAALPTLRYLQEHGARIVLCSHLGRPDGKIVESLRLKPVADRLAELLGQQVKVTRDCVGIEVESEVVELQASDVLLLENLRFHAEEELNDEMFSRQLASLGDLYVNDAFGAAHRAHASTVGVAAFLPAVAGLLMIKEIEQLGAILGNPSRPLAAILGGAKISSKITVLRNLLPRVDLLILGGGIASTFLKAQGSQIGDSLVEDDYLELAREILNEAKSLDLRVLLPLDVVIADAFAADAEKKTVPVAEIPAGWRILDAGPKTLGAYRKALETCRTVFWNGPLGVAEFPAFAVGSLALAQILAEIDAEIVVGGGESAALIEQAGLRDSYTHVSTGGGASLEFIEGRSLPGVEALLDRT